MWGGGGGIKTDDEKHDEVLLQFLFLCLFCFCWCPVFVLSKPYTVPLEGFCSLTLLLLNTCTVLANSVDPDQLASALFAIKYVNLQQQPGSSNMIG